MVTIVSIAPTYTTLPCPNPANAVLGTMASTPTCSATFSIVEDLVLDTVVVHEPVLTAVGDGCVRVHDADKDLRVSVTVGVYQNVSDSVDVCVRLVAVGGRVVVGGGVRDTDVVNETTIDVDMEKDPSVDVRLKLRRVLE